MLICIAADHGGFAFKNQLARALRAQDHEVIDFAAVIWIHQTTIPIS